MMFILLYLAACGLFSTSFMSICKHVDNTYDAIKIIVMIFVGAVLLLCAMSIGG